MPQVSVLRYVRYSTVYSSCWWYRTATDPQLCWQTTVRKAQHIPLLVVYTTFKTELNNLLPLIKNFLAKPLLKFQFLDPQVFH